MLRSSTRRDEIGFYRGDDDDDDGVAAARRQRDRKTDTRTCIYTRVYAYVYTVVVVCTGRTSRLLISLTRGPSGRRGSSAYTCGPLPRLLPKSRVSAVWGRLLHTCMGYICGGKLY